MYKTIEVTATGNVAFITGRFKGLFHTDEIPLIVKSPGRVNIIGEHTDYNDGFVLPAAIDKAAYVAVTRRNDDTISLYAEGFDDWHETTLNNIQRSEKGWPNYILGVVEQLQHSRLPLMGFNLYVDGDIPIGSGLSSSAAVECATLFALNELFSLKLARAEMALIAQKAEQYFAGVHCGVMDMFTSLFGRKGYAISLDCRNLLYDYVPLEIKGYKFLLLNTNVKHTLSSSEYNVRRSQCEEGVAMVDKHITGVTALRDVTIDMLNQYVLPQDPLIYQRCRYVVEENKRHLAACNDLQKGDIHSLGRRMFETHEGLSRHYEVSCPELDLLVSAVRDNRSVLGARMMGGGFGGCTINIVEETAIEDLVGELQPLYQQETGLSLEHYIVSVDAGTQVISTSNNRS